MQRLIVSSRRHAPAEKTVVVATPLDAILQLEGAGRIATVVLAGTYATHELATQLSELYPALHIECEA